MASVARAHDLNANLLRHWVSDHQRQQLRREPGVAPSQPTPLQRHATQTPPDAAPDRPQAWPTPGFIAPSRLPPELPRTIIRHEPASTACGCGCQMKRIREDATEKLDYTPGTFSVERHVRGVWACTACQSMTQASMPAYIIDKGIAAVGLLAQILISKYADHLPLYRQEAIFKSASREGNVVHQTLTAVVSASRETKGHPLCFSCRNSP